VVGISLSTLQRRKRTGELTPAEGEHLLRVAALMDRARQVFGDEAEAADWLTHENVALRHEAPLRMADTELGAREVEDLLGRLEAVFSGEGARRAEPLRSRLGGVLRARPGRPGARATRRGPARRLARPPQ